MEKFSLIGLCLCQHKKDSQIWSGFVGDALLVMTDLPMLIDLLGKHYHFLRTVDSFGGPINFKTDDERVYIHSKSVFTNSVIFHAVSLHMYFLNSMCLSHHASCFHTLFKW